MQLLQTCLSCVNNLSANPINRDAYRCPNLVNVLKKCLEHPNLNNLRSVTSIMAHMATEPEGALVILKTDTHQLIDREFATVEQVKSRHPTFQNNLNPEKENGIAEIGKKKYSVILTVLVIKSLLQCSTAKRSGGMWKN